MSLDSSHAILLFQNVISDLSWHQWNRSSHWYHFEQQQIAAKLSVLPAITHLLNSADKWLDQLAQEPGPVWKNLDCSVIVHFVNDARFFYERWIWISLELLQYAWDLECKSCSPKITIHLFENVRWFFPNIPEYLHKTVAVLHELYQIYPAWALHCVVALWSEIDLRQKMPGWSLKIDMLFLWRRPNPILDAGYSFVVIVSCFFDHFG